MKRIVAGLMAGKGGKGLLAQKTTAANKDKDKDKKRPVSRSSRAGIQVFHLYTELVVYLVVCFSCVLLVNCVCSRSRCVN